MVENDQSDTRLPLQHSLKGALSIYTMRLVTFLAIVAGSLLLLGLTLVITGFWGSYLSVVSLVVLVTTILFVTYRPLSPSSGSRIDRPIIGVTKYNRATAMRNFIVPIVIVVVLIIFSWPALSLWISSLFVGPRAGQPLSLGNSICGESARIVPPDFYWLVRTQGINVFNMDNTKVDDAHSAVLNNKIRALAMDTRGLWIGYFGTDGNKFGGVGHVATNEARRKSWADCLPPTPIAVQTATAIPILATPLSEAIRPEESSPDPTQTIAAINASGYAKGFNDVNAIAIGPKGNVWAATDQGGVLMFNGQEWTRYTTKDGLPDDRTFGISIDGQGGVWVSTWGGIAKFDGPGSIRPDRGLWHLAYSAKSSSQEGPLVSNNVHTIAFDSKSDIWVGYITRGVSQYRNEEGDWVHYETHNSEIGGNEVRSIAIRPADANIGSPESVWVATDGGGVSKYESGKWTVYSAKDGLPGDKAQAVAIDKYNRVWVATDNGVAYLENSKWITYHTFSAFSIAFGPTCEKCPSDGAFSDNTVWTGTQEKGLTQSRLPYLDMERAISVLSVTYPTVVPPGSKFSAEIAVSPRSPHQLTAERDFLMHIDEDDSNRFETHENLPVTGTLKVINSGQRYTFINSDRPFVAPELPEGDEEKTYTSTWRVWMDNGFAGPPIKIMFTVRRGQPTLPTVLPTVSPTPIPTPATATTQSP
jgi:hypothetical protein